MTYLLHYNFLESDALFFGRHSCLHLCASDISNRSYLPTYFAKKHHIIIPIFIAARITNLTFLTISYRSWDYRDEIVWAAVWLYRATNDRTYLNTAESLYSQFGLQFWNGAFNWDNKVSGVEVRYIKKLTMSLTHQETHKC
jgi:hypothetical protein